MSCCNKILYNDGKNDVALKPEKDKHADSAYKTMQGIASKLCRDDSRYMNRLTMALGIINFAFINYLPYHKFLIVIFAIFQAYIYAMIVRSSCRIKKLVHVCSFVSYVTGLLFIFADYNEALINMRNGNNLFIIVGLGSLIEEFTVQSYLKKVRLTDYLKQTKGPYTMVHLDAKSKERVYTKIDVCNIKKDMHLIILKPQTIPADGILINAGLLDESSHTGESLPIFKLKGDKVFAGTKLISSAIEIRTTSDFSTSSSMQTRQLIESLGLNSTNIHLGRFLRCILAYASAVCLMHYILLFLGLKSEFLYVEAKYACLVPIKVFNNILVAICPCALSLLEPLILSTISAQLKIKNIHIKDLKAIKSKIDYVIFDKTGTLTETIKIKNINVIKSSKLIVDAIKQRPNKTFTLDDLLYLIKVVQEGVDHPIAYCSFEYAKQKIENIVFDYCASKVSYNHVSGKKITGVLLIKDSKTNQKITYEIYRTKMTHFVKLDNTVVGYFNVVENIKKDAITCISQILSLGISVVVLSGDKLYPTKYVCENLGIQKYHAKQSSIDKFRYVKSLVDNKYKVMMVGDGFNDILAQKTATIGVSMLNYRSETGATISDGDLISVVLLLKTSQKVKKRILIGYAISLLYNLCICIIASGFLLPWRIYINLEHSCLLMATSSLFVLLYATKIKID